MMCTACCMQHVTSIYRFAIDWQGAARKCQRHGISILALC
jgi:hypothetical protein